MKSSHTIPNYTLNNKYEISEERDNLLWSLPQETRFERDTRFKMWINKQKKQVMSSEGNPIKPSKTKPIAVKLIETKLSQAYLSQTNSIHLKPNQVLKPSWIKLNQLK